MMKTIIYLFFTTLLLFACKKQDPCIDSQWYDQPNYNSTVHMEWAGELEITTDSCGKYSLEVNGKLVFEDSIPLTKKVFSMNKWDNYTVSYANCTEYMSKEIKVRQRYQDCSNQED